MPVIDYDIITLGHGSGGLLTNRLLDKTIFDIFHNDKLDTRHDGALLEFTNKVAFSTDSFVISPIFFPGGDIGELAVNGTVNDIAMCGAIPKYISLGFIIEEGLKMEEFWDVLIGVKYASEKAGVMVVTGDTKVVERGKGDKIFVNTTGIGELHPKANIDAKNIIPGDKILVSGNIATHGVAILSVRQGLEFETSIESDTTNLNKLTVALLDKYGEKIHLFRDPTRGGVSATLNEIARDVKLGIDLKQTSLPIDPQVDAACEILGLDPLYVANEGIFIAFVDSGIAEDVVETMKTMEEGANAAIIGEVVDDHNGKVIIESAIGGKRVVNMQIGEQLPRIC
ncbi:MAG TPA: hydrogenase expression/formation protein HypE [Bacteroidetes bacterium]|nr:hydrogenase expression/formation protein HypE [Bacteroidota bacterium]